MELSPEEKLHCEAALLPGERVLLLAKPRVEMDAVDAWWLIR